MGARRVILLACAALSSATLQLTQDTFDTAVFESGKSAFIKFFAPWCGHCKAMKPDWDKLAAEFEGSDKVLIADVDCTADDAEALCERFGVQGFPTLKYFSPPDEEGEQYEKSREYDDLKAFASQLGPGCSVDALENCSAEQKEELDKYVVMGAEARAARVAEVKAAISDAEQKHSKLVEQLQAQYEESEAAVEKMKKELTPELKMLKAAAPSMKPAQQKDEV